MEAIAIPTEFRVTSEQFDQLASIEQLARADKINQMPKYWLYEATHEATHPKDIK